MTASHARTSSEQRERVKVWDLPLRLFHWFLVIVIAIAFLSSEEDSALNQWHVLAGWVAGLLIVFRIVWGFVGGEHSRFADFIRPARIGGHISGLFRKRSESTLGHNPLGGISAVVLLALIAVTVWTGAFGGEGAEDLHEIIAWTLLAMVALHIAAVIIMSLLERENLVRAMITGNKLTNRHAGAVDAKRPTVLAALVALLALAGTAYAILRYDPHAFTLRSAEAYEQGISAVSDVSSADEKNERDD